MTASLYFLTVITALIIFVVIALVDTLKKRRNRDR
jgi:hypothetical protein